MTDNEFSAVHARFTRGEIPFTALHAAARAFAATWPPGVLDAELAKARALLSSAPIKETTHMPVPAPEKVMVDAVAYADLQRQAAAAPELIARVPEAKRSLAASAALMAQAVAAQRNPSRLAAPATPAPERSEADWEEFGFSIGQPGCARPERPFGVVWTGGADVPVTASRSDADFTAFAASLGLDRRQR